MGAGLKRDLALRSVSSEGRLSKTNLEGAQKVLNAAATFVKNNAQTVLNTLPAGSFSQKTPSLTEKDLGYTQVASDDKNTDYAQILKQQRRENARSEQNAEADRPISDETAQRIRCIIARAAAAARRGNLYPDAQTRENPVSDQVAKDPSLDNSQETTANNKDNEVSLSELAARASKLQQPFREDRRKLAAEGKLPDPAAYPEENETNISKPDPLPKGNETAVDLLKNAAKAVADPKTVPATPKDLTATDNEAGDLANEALLKK
ncbi:MAG TPA: hypothetical protein DCL74_07505, partial [Succinivibrionaceae bacterium]|nr:hypothetical protein [Succinivibrionaceae bacterium]